MKILFRLVARLVGSLSAPVDTARVKKALVVDFSFLGDVVMTSVVHHAVRRQIPGAAVHVFGVFIPCEVRLFDAAAVDDARAWIKA